MSVVDLRVPGSLRWTTGRIFCHWNQSREGGLIFTSVFPLTFVARCSGDPGFVAELTRAVTLAFFRSDDAIHFAPWTLDYIANAVATDGRGRG